MVCGVRLLIKEPFHFRGYDACYSWQTPRVIKPKPGKEDSKWQTTHELEKNEAVTGHSFLRGWWRKLANDMALWFKGELSSLDISKKEPAVWELRELQSPAGEEVTKLRLPFSRWQNGNAVWNIEEELTTLRRMATTHELRTEDFLYLEKAQFHVDLCSSCQNYPSMCIRDRLFTSQDKTDSAGATWKGLHYGVNSSSKIMCCLPAS